MRGNRREFLKKSGCALSMLALATQARHFGMMSALAQTMDDNPSAADAPSDYRALVCIFLSGGNDGNNMVVPVHNDANISNYQAYLNARNTQGLALTQAQLASINVPRLGNLTYGLHYNLATMMGRTDIPDNSGALGGTRNGGIAELWAQGKLAIVPNVGNLVRPMTRAQYQSNSVQKPYQLFSHSDQVQQQQSSRSDRRVYNGWGGKIADLRNTPDNPGALVPMISSIAGTQIFTIGQTNTPLAIASGNTALNSVLVLQNLPNTTEGNARRTALHALRTQDLENNVVKAMSQITDQAVAASTALSTFQEVTVTFPNTGLGLQLKQVARMIKKRTDLNIKRQIFFVQLGGFDTHTGQIATISTGQNGLFIQLGQAMRAFYDEMVAQGIQNGVTSFTLSDFGRTFNPAGQGAGAVGSDHAWGNHLMVMGGAVLGGDFYGSTRPDGSGSIFPTLVQGGPDDTDGGTAPRGRWIPTTSVEQYAATLARWYGLPESEIPVVFPNSVNFPTTNLGFMNP
jgi:uncharacterized protein (DUF1501 family)